MLHRLPAFWPLHFSLSASADTIVLNSGDSCSAAMANLAGVAFTRNDGVQYIARRQSSHRRGPGSSHQRASKTITAENAAALSRHCGYAL